VEERAVPPLPVDDWFRMISKSLTVRGFRAAEYADEHAAGRKVLGELVASGRLVLTVHIVKGLDQVPAAFVDMMNNRASAKVVVAIRDS
jgi:NADPH-dependent curcumin reductase CurA